MASFLVELNFCDICGNISAMLAILFFNMPQNFKAFQTFAFYRQLIINIYAKQKLSTFLALMMAMCDYVSLCPYKKGFTIRLNWNRFFKKTPDESI